MSSLIVSHISKQFPSASGPKKILDDVSFEVPAGQIACLLGPNGSGKTTLLKTIAALLDPDAGEVRLGDLNVHKRPLEAKRLLGFASSEDHSFYGRLTVRQNLRFYGQLHGLNDAETIQRLDKVAGQLELGPIFDRPFRELSSGQKQRILLARALLHEPPVLLLDEPNQNLDHHFMARLHNMITHEWSARAGKSIVVSTHHLEDALKISDRWIVLSGGKVRFNGSISEERRKRGDFAIEKFFDDLTLQLAAGEKRVP